MNTLFDKIWDKHVVQIVEDGPTQLYIDRLYCHEVTSPQAFDGMRARGLKCFRPDHIYCMPDHNTPTHDQDRVLNLWQRVRESHWPLSWEKSFGLSQARAEVGEECSELALLLGRPWVGTNPRWPWTGGQI